MHPWLRIDAMHGYGVREIISRHRYRMRADAAVKI